MKNFSILKSFLMAFQLLPPEDIEEQKKIYQLRLPISFRNLKLRTVEDRARNKVLAELI